MTQLDRLRSFAGRTVVRFCRDESGATAIEYAMIAAGVGVAVSTAVMSTGSNLKENFYDKLASLFP